MGGMGFARMGIRARAFAPTGTCGDEKEGQGARREGRSVEGLFMCMQYESATIGRDRQLRKKGSEVCEMAVVSRGLRAP
ncbi:MAG: hypothetical protein EGQ84_02800 [Slackia sp.]|nr:hypothetical protein [Slackia sp.]